MKTEQYQIVKHGRGKYQVFGPGGEALSGNDISQFTAGRIRTVYQLQDKALKDARLLKIVARITGLTGEALSNWLYEILIRMEIEEIRLYLNKTSEFKRKVKEIHEANVEARRKSSE